MLPSSAARRFRGFLKWMSAHGVQYSDGLDLTLGDGIVSDIGVKALYDFHEGDLIATIPKEACLTVKTTGAAELIREAELVGSLGLAVALMYERSRKERSPWYEYLQLLPVRQALPMVWEPHEIELLRGTELHAAVQEDKKLIKDDWEECIYPLCQLYPRDFPLEYFSLEQYFSAKTLVASRAFEIDKHHGYGMVPLADLFNHNTAAEDVHFTNITSDSESDVEDFGTLKWQKAAEQKGGSPTFSRRDDEMRRLERNERLAPRGLCNSFESSNGTSDDLEMILVKDVSRGSEIFNTYGNLSNAALLHRYGFTELGNPYDIINIDFALVVEYCTLVFSERHVRNRVRFWRRFGCTACKTQNGEYFEISACGEPQIDLLFLLYIVHLSDDVFGRLDLTADKADGGEGFTQSCLWTDHLIDIVLDTANSFRNEGSKSVPLRGRHQQDTVFAHSKQAVNLQDFCLTPEVCKGLLWLYNRRDKMYAAASLEEDQLLLETLSRTAQPKLFHALSLRVSERRILRNLCQEVSNKVKGS